MRPLKRYLLENRISQPEFARLADVHQSTVSRLCKGEDEDGKLFRPHASTAVRIAKATGGAVTVADLLLPAMHDRMTVADKQPSFDDNVTPRKVAS